MILLEGSTFNFPQKTVCSENSSMWQVSAVTQRPICPRLKPGPGPSEALTNSGV